mgnify:CR=1 FL=1
MRSLLTALLLSLGITASAFAITDTNFRPANWGLAGSWSTISVTTSSYVALAANPGRVYLLIQNNDTGSSTIRVKFNSAITGTEGVVITAGGNYEPMIPPTGSVHVQSSAASGVTATIIEGIK